MTNPDLGPKGESRRHFLVDTSLVLAGAAAFGPLLTFPSRTTAATQAAAVGPGDAARELIGPQSPFTPVVFVNPGEPNHWHEIYDSTIRAGIPSEITGTMAFRPGENTPPNSITGLMITNGKEAGSQDENALMLVRSHGDGELRLQHRHGGRTDLLFSVANAPQTVEDFTISVSEDGRSVKLTAPVGSSGDKTLTESLFSRGPIRLMEITNGYAETYISRLSVMQAPIDLPLFADAEPSLRGLAERRGFSIGTLASTKRAIYDPRFEPILASQFNHIVLDGDLAWQTVHRTRDKYDFSRADQMVNFAVRNGMQVYGQSLIWGELLPRWLTEGGYEPSEVLKIMDEHITEVMGHFGTTVRQWVPVNEALSRDLTGNYQDNFWFRMLGPNYIKQAFEIAKRVNQAATLLYNDFDNETPNPKTEKILEIARDLQREGLINGIGMQMHVLVKQPPRFEAMQASVRSVNSMGLQAIGTEADFNMAGASGTPAEKQQRQEEVVGNIADVFLQSGSGRLTLGGIENTVSPLAGWGIEFESPHILTDYKPTRAFFGLRNALSSSK